MISQLFKKTLRRTIITSDLQQETKQDDNGPNKKYTIFYGCTVCSRATGRPALYVSGSQATLLIVLVGGSNRLIGKPLRKDVLNVLEQEFVSIREISVWRSA